MNNQKIPYEYRFVLDPDYRGEDVSSKDLPNQIVQLNETPRVGDNYMIDSKLFEVIKIRKSITLNHRNERISGVESKLVNVFVSPIFTI